MKKKAIIYSVALVTLVAVFLFALTKTIPGFGEVKLPVLSYVHPFSFTDQNGKQVSQVDVNGKVYVAEFFFTTCKGICPKLNNNIKKIYAAFPNENNLVFLSHTVDPDIDSVGRLKSYADSMGINNSSRWHLLTGSKDSLYYAARASYLLDDPKNNDESIEQQFLHTQFFALIDKAGRVRKIYDGLKANELDDLKKDITDLLKES